MITRLSRRGARLAAVGAIGLITAACGGPRAPKPAAVRALDHVAAPGVDEPFPNGSYTEIEGDYKRFDKDISRAAIKIHWGTLHLEPLRTPGASKKNKPLGYRAELLLPDGRTARLTAWKRDERHVALAIRVGQFGAPSEEALYAGSLRSVLAGKAMPVRKNKFELPEWPPATRPETAPAVE